MIVPQKEHFLPAVMPFLLQVAATAGISTSVWFPPSAGIVSVLVSWHTEHSSSLLPAVVQVAAVREVSVQVWSVASWGIVSVLVCRLSFCPAADNCLADTAYLLNFFGILAGSGCDFLLCVMLACSRDFFCVGLAANSTGCGFLPLIHASRSFCDSAHPCGMLRGKRLILCVLAFGAGKQLDAGCVCGAVRLPDDS